MTWNTVVNVFAVMGAVWTVALMAGGLLCWLFMHNPDVVNRDSTEG